MATNVMLATQRFRRANKRWEEQSYQAKTWSAWKKLYKEADHQAKISRIAAGGNDQFGAAHKAGSMITHHHLHRRVALLQAPPRPWMSILTHLLLQRPLKNQSWPSW